MKLITQQQMNQLHKNYQLNSNIIEQCSVDTIDHKPVIKLFTPWGSCTWLLTELGEDGRGFGLCDLGHGYPEMGYVALEELKSIKGPFGLRIERDRSFHADKTLSEYATLARAEERISA